jgi:hypothetical protein
MNEAEEGTNELFQVIVAVVQDRARCQRQCRLVEILVRNSSSKVFLILWKAARTRASRRGQIFGFVF